MVKISSGQVARIISTPQAEVSLSLVSENALLVTWPEKICSKQHQQIINLQAVIEHELAQWLVDLVPAYNSLMVYYLCQQVHAQDILLAIEQLLLNDELSQNRNIEARQELVEIPVYYGQQGGIDDCLDIHDVAKQTGLTLDDITALHTGTVYRAYALGFTPGFCYLGSLAKPLQLARKACPRVQIPKGAVAIAGQQTSVYPNTSPGGWHIIGRTPMAMYQLGSEAQEQQSFLPTVSPGQQVKFKAISLTEFIELGGQTDELCTNQSSRNLVASSIASDSAPALHIKQLKGYCSFQDLGRGQYQHLGFSASGVADEFAFLFANKLLGNQANAVAIELFFGQLTLVAEQDCEIAITGATSQIFINDQVVETWRCYQLNKGDQLKLTLPRIGVVSYLAIKNGFSCQQWLGSASQNSNETALGFGEPQLELGQTLNANKSREAYKSLGSSQLSWQNFYQQQLVDQHTLVTELPPLALRFIPSPLFSSFDQQQQAQFLAQLFSISPDSNKMGYRLLADGIPLTVAEEEARKLSKPVCYGTIQLPANGQPIVLMKNRQTIGGYPVLGTVMQTDLFRLAQKRPGERVKFALTSVEFAQQQLNAFYLRFYGCSI